MQKNLNKLNLLSSRSPDETMRRLERSQVVLDCRSSHFCSPESEVLINFAINCQPIWSNMPVILSTAAFMIVDD